MYLSRRSLSKITTFFQLCKKIDRFGKELPAFMREMQYLCSENLTGIKIIKQIT